MPSRSNNPFGIKAARGQQFVMASPQEETRDHKMVPIMAPFRFFASMDEAFDQHGRLLAKHPAYKLARQYLNNPDAYARALTHHYASDDGYGEKLVKNMKTYNLYKYNKLLFNYPQKNISQDGQLSRYTFLFLKLDILFQKQKNGPLVV